MHRTISSVTEFTRGNDKVCETLQALTVPEQVGYRSLRRIFVSDEAIRLSNLGQGSVYLPVIGIVYHCFMQ
ncbi:MAG: hypothetical protein IPI37_02680 [Bacteroidales bacterium]|nr:hypothetical protein [Bacteroidales bacterium]